MGIELNLWIQVIRFKIKEYPCRDAKCCSWIIRIKLHKFIESFETIRRYHKISLWILSGNLNRWLLFDNCCFLDVFNEVSEISFWIILSPIEISKPPNGFISNQKRHRFFCFLKWVVLMLVVRVYTIIARVILQLRWFYVGCLLIFDEINDILMLLWR